MEYVLLVLHIATAIVFIGGVTVSASIFPRYAMAEAAAPYEATGGHPGALAMHRITKGYGRLAVITPAIGFILALILGRLDELWILISIGLVVLGGVVLVVKIIPMQQEMLREPPTDPQVRKRAVGYAGLLNAIWLTILVLMITKPGGTG